MSNRSQARRLFAALFRYGTRIVGAVVIAGVACTLPWRWIDPPTTAFMLFDKSDVEVEQSWIDLEEIAPVLQLAVVAAEDQKFPQHHGFDLQAISEALEDDSKRRRGASTITQQLVKNMYLWPGRSYVRKGIEAYLTFWMELLLPKSRILELYLNLVEFGNGVYGADMAAERHFGKEAINLTRREAAMLAAVLPNPKSRSAQRPSAYVRRRASEIERMMINLGANYLEGL